MKPSNYFLDFLGTDFFVLDTTIYKHVRACYHYLLANLAVHVVISVVATTHLPHPATHVSSMDIIVIINGTQHTVTSLERVQ
jgi:hypothetical protein